MPATSPIVVIEDDIDDQHLLVKVFERLGFKNKVFYFADGQSALSFLRIEEVKPLLVLADINMPKMNGFEVRDKLLEDPLLREKFIPYIFFTTAADPKSIKTAHERGNQGYFIKPRTMDELETMIRNIVLYWLSSERAKSL